MSSLHGFGLGIVSENAEGTVLDTFYPQPVAHLSGELASVLSVSYTHLTLPTKA